MAQRGTGESRHREIFLCFVPDDKELADRFEKALRKHKPLPEQQPFTVFKEEHDLLNSDYYEVIQHQFENADKLVFITSETFDEHPVVQEKIAAFAATRGPEHTITVKAGKSTNGQSPVGGPLIRYDNFDIEKDSPLGEAHSQPWNQLLAILQEADLEAISAHEARKRRQRRLMLRLGITAGSLVLIASLALLWWNSTSSDRREKRQSIVNQINQEWQEADIAIDENRHLLGAYLAFQAFQDAPDERFRRKLLRKLGPVFPRTRLLRIFQHDGEVTGGRFSNDESIIATWGADQQIHLWDAISGQPVGKQLSHRGMVLGAVFNGDNRLLLSWGEDNAARVWNVSKQSQALRTLRHKDVITGATFSNDEKLILTWGNDGAARIWDARSGRMKTEVFHREGWVNGALLNERNSRLLTWSSDSTARIWRVDNGLPIGRPLKHGGGVNGGHFFDKDRRIITWSDDGDIRQWYSANGRSAAAKIRHNDAVVGTRLDQHEERLLSWGHDGTARLWRLTDGKALINPLKHDGWVFGAAFSRNESLILTWSFDNTLRIWEANTGAPMGNPMSHSSGPRGRDAGVFGAVFSSKENMILSWGDDNSVRLWNPQDQTLYGLPMQHQTNDSLNREAKGAIFNRAGTRVLSWSNDGTARYWQVLPIDAMPTGQVLDFPSEDILLQLEALTGVTLDTNRKAITSIDPNKWREMVRAYRQKAQAHLAGLEDKRQSLWGYFVQENR